MRANRVSDGQPPGYTRSICSNYVEEIDCPGGTTAPGRDDGSINVDLAGLAFFMSYSSRKIENK